MKIFANEINNNYFRNLVGMVSKASKLEVAVAYITDESLFAEALQKDIPVSIWTLVNEEISLRTMEILKKYSQYPKFKISVFRDNFHAKAIWFHGVGCYFGSANLSDNGLNKNIELGVFIDQEDESNFSNLEDLKSFFTSLKDYSAIVDQKMVTDLYNKLKRIHQNESVKEAKREIIGHLKDDLNELNLYLDNLFKNTKIPNRSQTKESLSKHRFITEWKSSIQILNETASDYKKFGVRPSWIPDHTNTNIEVDRMLSWYYDNHVKDRTQGNVYDLIQRMHDQNVGHGKQNMEEVFKLWKNLPIPPEEGIVEFFGESSPLIESFLHPSRILGLTNDELGMIVSNCHALAGRIDKFISYDTLGLNKGIGQRVSVQEKAKAYVNMELSSLNNKGRRIQEILQYFIWGGGLVEERLWQCLDKESGYYFEGIGRSTLGELIGRARPDEYPVRNERISRTLYALGFEVDYQ